MAVIKVMVAEHIISGFRHTLDFYYYKGLACVRKWPASPGHHRAPAVQAQWTPFLEAVALAKQLSPAIIEYYKSCAEGTRMTWKDIFFRSYLSGLPTTVYQGKE